MRPEKNTSLKLMLSRKGKNGWGQKMKGYESSTFRKRLWLVLRVAWLSVEEEYPRRNMIYLLAINGTVVVNDEELSDSAQLF